MTRVYDPAHTNGDMEGQNYFIRTGPRIPCGGTIIKNVIHASQVALFYLLNPSPNLSGQLWIDDENYRTKLP